MPNVPNAMVGFLTGRVSMRQVARSANIPWSTFQRTVAQGRPFTGERYSNIAGMYRSFVRDEARAIGYPTRITAQLARLRPQTVEMRFWEQDSIVQNLATHRTNQDYTKAKAEGKDFDWNKRYDAIENGIRRGMSRSQLPWDEVKERYGKG